MNLKRIIPVILIEDSGAFLTKNFNKRKYIGDPVNITKIFSSKTVHEILIVCPKGWTNEKKTLVKLARQARVPLSISGKIKNLNDIRELLEIGFEKVVLSPKISIEQINYLIDVFGGSTISLKLDLKLSGLINKRYRIDGKDPQSVFLGLNGVEFNELIFTDISRDGSRKGFNKNLVKIIEESTIFKSGEMNIGYCGGINGLDSIQDLFKKDFSSVYAGTYFSTTSSNDGVLINYPNDLELNQIL